MGMTNEEAAKIIDQYDVSSFTFYTTDGETIPGILVMDAFDLAIVALQAQQPRVLTLEEVLGGDECWIEGRSGACGYGDALLTNDAERVEFYRPHTISTLDFYEYGRAWRCWNRRPTDEQREAAAWENG